MLVAAAVSNRNALPPLSFHPDADQPAIVRTAPGMASEMDPP
jgi:hypothetical protein